MNRREFIQKIFVLFRKKPENNEDLIVVYDNAFSTKKPVDWDKLYTLTVAQAESSTLPMPQWFTSKFDMCLKDVDYATADGLQIRVLIKDRKHPEGYPYDFETYKNNLTFDELKQKAMKKWGDNFLNMQIFDEIDLKWVRI